LRISGIVSVILFSLLVQTDLLGQSNRLDGPLKSILDGERDDPKPILQEYLKALDKLAGVELEKKALETIKGLETAPDSEVIIYTLQQLGLFYQNRNLPSESIAFFQLAYNKASKSNSRLQMGMALKEIALVYLNEEMLTESLTYIYQSLKIFEERKFYTRAMITLYEASLINYRASNFIGAVNDFRAAMELYNKLPGDSISDDLKFRTMSGWNTAGLSYKAMKRPREGLDAFDQSYRIAHELHNEFWQGLVNGNKGELLLQVGQPEEAIRLIKEDIKISLRFDQYQSAAMASCILCSFYTGKKDLKIAKHYLDTATLLLQLSSSSPKAQGRLLLAASHYYGAVGDYENAYQALVKYKIVSDSSVNQERLILLSQVKAQNDLERKQNEIQLLTQVNVLQRGQIKNQELLILSSVLTLILVAGFLFYAGSNNKKLKKKNSIIETQREEIELKNQELKVQSQILQEQNQLMQTNNVELEVRVKERTEQLEGSNKELDTFLYHASHDIRRPIATLLGLEQVSRLSDNDLKSKYLFDYVADTARDMDRMLFKLQMAYELNRLVKDRAWISLQWVIDMVAKRFDNDFYRLQIAYSHEQTKVISCFASPNLLTIIFSNLIENAVNFRSKTEGEQAFIRIASSQVGQTVTVTVEDNGCGIQEQFLERIFELYFRATERSKGNGLGLYLAKKAATLMNGTINVTSRYEVGSLFILTFLVNDEGVIRN
jgi:signal transduction histidine kinase/tetratricopeptide (TPR) repeat protein